MLAEIPEDERQRRAARRGRDQQRANGEGEARARDKPGESLDAPTNRLPLIRIPAVPLSACSPLIRRLGGDTPRRARRTRDGVDSQGPQSPASTVAARCLAAHRRRLLFGKRAGPKPLTYRTGVGGGLGALHPGHDDRSGLGLVRASLLLGHDVDRRVGCKSAAGQADACCRS